jgi:hypothetical protein
VIATVAPCADKARAIAQPIPREAPVTSATLPAKVELLSVDSITFRLLGIVEIFACASLYYFCIFFQKNVKNPCFYPAYLSKYRYNNVFLQEYKEIGG